MLIRSSTLCPLYSKDGWGESPRNGCLYDGAQSLIVLHCWRGGGAGLEGKVRRDNIPSRNKRVTRQQQNQEQGGLEGEQKRIPFRRRHQRSQPLLDSFFAIMFLEGPRRSQWKAVGMQDFFAYLFMHSVMVTNEAAAVTFNMSHDSHGILLFPPPHLTGNSSMAVSPPPAPQ